MKKFTESNKWEDSWFRKLKPHEKILWVWLLDKCDHAGVIEPDMELATFHIGYQYSNDNLDVFSDRLVKIDSNKCFIPKYIPFQYGSLSKECKAHNPVFASLEKHNIDATNLQYKGYPKGIDTLQYKDKDKDKDNTKNKSKGTEQEFVEFAKELGLTSNDGVYLFAHFEESDWKRGKDPVKDWKAAMRKWKAAGWLPSQKNCITTKSPRPINEPLKYQQNGNKQRGYGAND
jgi:hypothetical protein